MRTKKRTIAEAQSLVTVDHKEILIMSRVKAGHISNAEVARRMGLGEETVARYQRYPKDGEQDFSLPAHRIPSWNAAVGNHLVSEWVAQRDGGLFVRVDAECSEDMNVVSQVGKVNREIADVTDCMLQALADGTMDSNDVNSLLKELLDARKALDETIIAARGQATTGKA
jgi:hypothetical protein